MKEEEYTNNFVIQINSDSKQMRIAKRNLFNKFNY